MKFTYSTFSKSLILMGLLSSFTLAQADLPKAFDYNIASTNYVDNTSSGGDLFSKGYYLGGAIGQSEASTFCNGASSCEDSDSAWKIFGGYQIIDKVSVEGAYLNLGDIRRDGQSSDVSAFAAYGVGTLPVTEKFDAFAKIGGAYWRSENSDGNKNGFGLAYGIGAKMAMNETTKIRAEWEKITDVETSNNQDSDVNMLSIGVEFNTF
ncbi:MAG: outer membrane beta-barrel protein [Cocleimonas sp.]